MKNSDNPRCAIAALEACTQALERLHATVALAHLQSAIDQLKIQFNLDLTTLDNA